MLGKNVIITGQCWNKVISMFKLWCRRISRCNTKCWSRPSRSL